MSAVKIVSVVMITFNQRVIASRNLLIRGKREPLEATGQLRREQGRDKESEWKRCKFLHRAGSVRLLVILSEPSKAHHIVSREISEKSKKLKKDSSLFYL